MIASKLTHDSVIEGYLLSNIDAKQPEEVSWWAAKLINNLHTLVYNIVLHI